MSCIHTYDQTMFMVLMSLNDKLIVEAFISKYAYLLQQFKDQDMDSAGY